MAPTKIMIIRHGEKEADFPDDPNVDREGRPDPASLNHRGWRRAGALVGFFRNAQAPGIATPDRIFAAAPKATSRRSLDTITPLAEALWPQPARALSLRSDIPEREAGALIATVMDGGGVSLICWQHGAIPEIAARIPHWPRSPRRWSGYDDVWVFDAGPSRWTFRAIPQGDPSGPALKPPSPP